MFHYGTHEAHDDETPVVPTLSEVMRKAWERYKRVAWAGEKFSRKLFAKCLREAWSILREPGVVAYVNETELRELAK